MVHPPQMQQPAQGPPLKTGLTFKQQEIERQQEELKKQQEELLKMQKDLKKGQEELAEEQENYERKVVIKDEESEKPSRKNRKVKEKPPVAPP